MSDGHPLLVEIGEGISLMIGLPTIAIWDSENRPKKAKLGTFGFNSDTNNLEYWNGSAWLTARMKEV